MAQVNTQVTYVPYLHFDLSICLSFDLSGFENYISQNLSQNLSIYLSILKFWLKYVSELLPRFTLPRV